MPHIILKVWPGKSEEKKQQLAEEIKKLTMDILETPESSISVSYEVVKPEDWAREVYKPDILDKEENLYIKPGYVPEEFN